ncbi:RsiV family protein [Mycolicibacterium sp. Dal123E01]|uniref:RsiV family protein n=1 Tax=Mycolicibacterium sp. Dal123E01 TaxID=3457578 RepID=UPI00403E991A
MAGQASAAPIDPTELCSSHNPAGDCVWGAAGPRSSVDVVLPANSPLERGIVDFAAKATNDYYAAEAGVQDFPAPPSRLEVSYQNYTSGSPQTGTQTAVVKADQYLSGAAYPLIWYKAFPYKNATRTPITFDTLFAPGSHPLDVIMPIVNQQISADAGQPFTVDPAVGLDPANYQNFAITNDAVIFFFDKNQLQAATGNFEVSVPRSVIAPMLSPGI